MVGEMQTKERLPVLIIGAGISGLILAQQLRKLNIPFLIFDRDSDFATRNVGWGITLHWSLPALRKCLPEDIVARIPQAYVGRAAVESGELTAYPFFDLTTGELKGATPKLSEAERIRVSRQRLRCVLATGIDVQWGKAFRTFEEDEDSVTVTFEDGSISTGSLLVGCDGSHSRVRRKIFPDEHANNPLPIRLFGFTIKKTAEEVKPIRDLDPFVLYGTASGQNNFMFLSLLDGPGDNDANKDDYVYSVCISRHLQDDEKKQADKHVPSPNEALVESVKKMAMHWAEPFRSFILSSIDQTEIKQLDLADFVPRVRKTTTASSTSARTVLIGDSLHTMTMYRGEGANHAIVDVLQFKEKVIPNLDQNGETLRRAIREFENGVVERTRPAVLASRQACLDGHNWERLMDTKPPSPLLTRREMRLQFEG